MHYPAWTIYTDNLPEGFGGCAKAFIVFLRPKYRDDSGIHAHENEHVRQFWLMSLLACLIISMAAYTTKFGGIVLPVSGYSFVPLGFGAHPMLYQISSKYRLWAEARAYRIQLKYYPDDRSTLFAGFIATMMYLSNMLRFCQ